MNGYNTLSKITNHSLNANHLNFNIFNNVYYVFEH